MGYEHSMNKQIIIIGGGETFDTYKDYLNFLKGVKVELSKNRKSGWKQNLQKHLGHGCSVYALSMPSPLNAKYQEWEIYFRKIIPQLEHGCTLIGHSLGGMFLAKFFSENTLPLTCKSIIMVSAPFGKKKGFADFHIEQSKLSNITHQFEETILIHSVNDDIVASDDMIRYRQRIPGSTGYLLADGGHFIFNGKITKLIHIIKKLYSKK